ncbi:hypothetical protein J6TS7_46820 [Paenibacillus dendritiformis]|nr:hypothetical protein J6TS7_46820 [Paenibacillus dendritiformis]
MFFRRALPVTEKRERETIELNVNDRRLLEVLGIDIADVNEREKCSKDRYGVCLHPHADTAPSISIA